MFCTTFIKKLKNKTKTFQLKIFSLHRFKLLLKLSCDSLFNGSPFAHSLPASVTKWLVLKIESCEWLSCKLLGCQWVHGLHWGLFQSAKPLNCFLEQIKMIISLYVTSLGTMEEYLSPQWESNPCFPIAIRTPNLLSHWESNLCLTITSQTLIAFILLFLSFFPSLHCKTHHLTLLIN